MATITITTPGPQDADIAATLGVYLNLVDASGNPRSATLAEIKALIIFDLKQHYRETKEAIAAAAAKAAVTDITPT